jgi:hypothetical protein
MKGQFSCDRDIVRMNLELINSRGLREIDCAGIESNEQDLCALRNQAGTHLSGQMDDNPAIVAKHVNQLP